MNPHLHFIATAELWPTYPRVTRTAIAEELAATAAWRAANWPDWVAKGKLHASESAAQTRLWQAVQQDAQRLLQPAHLRPAASHGASWADRRAALQRELAWRRTVWPDWVAKGRITAEQARFRTHCLQALLDDYDGGFDWQASNGAPCNWASLAPSPENIAARAEWSRHAQSLIATPETAMVDGQPVLV